MTDMQFEEEKWAELKIIHVDSFPYNFTLFICAILNRKQTIFPFLIARF